MGVRLDADTSQPWMVEDVVTERSAKPATEFLIITKTRRPGVRGGGTVDSLDRC